jgi:hypothetical protein
MVGPVLQSGGLKLIVFEAGVKKWKLVKVSFGVNYKLPGEK